MTAPADRLRSLLAAGATPITVNSPPGAGKTSLVATSAADAARGGGRVCVVTNTNNQAAEAAARAAAERPAAPVVLTLGADAAVPAHADDEIAAGRLTVIRPFEQLPDGPAVVVGTAAKWGCHPATSLPPYDLQILEECFQLPWHSAWPLADLARRHLSVGDPGQVQPFSPADDRRWRGDPLSPLAPAAEVIRRLAPDGPVVDLTVSHRLPDDTCRVLQPHLYPALRFRGAAAPGERRLVPAVPPAHRSAEAWDALAGSSIAAWELPAAPAVPLDPGLCTAAADAVSALLAGTALTVENGRVRPLRPERVAVACARRQQVAQVRSALTGPARGRVAVDTANRLQGMTFDVVVAVCPLVGHAAFSAFELEPGRLSVMLSRHRVACLLVTRADVPVRLRRHVPVSDRVLGLGPDPELRGWRAHAGLRDDLARRGLVVAERPAVARRGPAVRLRPSGASGPP